MNNDNICPICYDSLEDNNTTKIECGHKFHINCIIKWFRTGSEKCPLCNDSTIDTSNINYYTKLTTIKEIKKLGRRKNCPSNLKNLLNKIKKKEEEKKNNSKQRKEFNLKYKEELKIYNKLRNNSWKIGRKIRELEHKLLAQIVLKPIYIK